jgi:hypothetical protein
MGEIVVKVNHWSRFYILGKLEISHGILPIIKFLRNETLYLFKKETGGEGPAAQGMGQPDIKTLDPKGINTPLGS